MPPALTFSFINTLPLLAANGNAITTQQTRWRYSPNCDVRFRCLRRRKNYFFLYFRTEKNPRDARIDALVSSASEFHKGERETARVNPIRASNRAELNQRPEKLVNLSRLLCALLYRGRAKCSPNIHALSRVRVHGNTHRKHAHTRLSVKRAAETEKTHA